MSQFVWTFPGGKLKQPVTSLTLVNNTEKVEDIAVPTGKIWVLLSVKARNPDDVTRDISVRTYKEAAKTNQISILTTQTVVPASVVQWPNTDPSSLYRQIPSVPAELLAAGNVLEITWAAGGASAGGTDADGLVIAYLEIDAP